MSRQDSTVRWIRSSRSVDAGGNCVEIAVVGDAIFCRDSKNVSAGELRLAAEGWSQFVLGVKAGEFDLPRN